MQGPLLGIDYGSKRIGVARSDALGISTEPVGFIERQSDAQAAAMVVQLVRHYRIAGIIFGLPVHAQSGDEGGNALQVRAFMAEVAALCDLPQATCDERYSSAEAEEALRLAGEWPVKPGRLDAKAAAIILRRYLDAVAGS